ncbi:MULTISPECIES: 1-phosphofructokinase [Clostridium]|uniref:Tagatose-6-phosphate kinase n=2 Tax=Clostridium TaxID=1485 RepID=A0A151ANT2_9CLOT|nr:MULTISPECIES: 1-phosphofructokinase [Clostridium]KYH29279.1 tagatose-6-phosphate kinase [Clostridium colicanis DSM 13634]PRR71007.1 Tagatose-6-phosphate kinase [Clostridium thermopalmarium DSM 5974]PVZ23653.1 tagatose 6-phosphate kinase [Clostridium thermopalmarium DSM 5974]
MITTVTLNASIDKAYYMDGIIENGKVMRVASCRNSAGGKGLNVARIVKLCGSEVQATGFVGGFNGKYLEALLDIDGIPHNFKHVKGETRSCINILDKKYGSTEYLEPGCEITSEEESQFIELFPNIIKNSSIITISGSIPKGVSKDIYAQMVLIAKKMGKHVLLDTSGELLKRGIKSCPTMVKPNKDELEQLFHIKIKGIEDVIRYAKKIFDFGIPYVIISLGSDGALMVCKEGVFLGSPPVVEVVNTVGCGDSMVGAFAVALERNIPSNEILRYAIAVATANAMSTNTGDFDPDICRKIINDVNIRRL